MRKTPESPKRVVGVVLKHLLLKAFPEISQWHTLHWYTFLNP